MSVKADPCSQPSLMHPDQAIPLLLEQVSPVSDTEVVTLPHALGRVLAEDRFADLNSQTEHTTLTLIGSSFAGHGFEGEITPNSCVRIMTGAPVPAGYDTVQMQEETQAQGNQIQINHPKAKGANVRCRGEELLQGTKVLKAGIEIKAAELGVLATIGVSQVRVYRQLKVAFFSTGDELRPVGSDLAPGQIYDSNRYSIQGLLSPRAKRIWY